MIPLLCASGMAGCVFPDFAAYDDQSLADYEVAVINNRWSGCPFCVREVVELTEGGKSLRLVFDFDRDGNRSRLKLLPGRYEIYAEDDGPKSRGSLREVVKLEAGHVYEVRSKACLAPYYFSHDCVYGSAIVNMIDKTSGRLVAGKPW
jgi:hypothetical protein